jgi:hypothetical protein
MSLRATSRSHEERLRSLLAERRRELEEHVARVEEAATDIERREELLRDSRASLERLLRLGANDLDARESELQQRLAELDEREVRVRADEAELARRRGEVGAVELRRASVELRERALDERETELGEREARIAVASATPQPSAALLAFVPSAGYGLVELEEPATAGQQLVLEGEEYAVARLGPSPLPADERRCAYLVRGPRGEPGGSS